MPKQRRARNSVLSARSVAAFYAVFGLYAAAALFLLWLGMASALAAAARIAQLSLRLRQTIDGGDTAAG